MFFIPFRMCQIYILLYTFVNKMWHQNFMDFSIIIGEKKKRKYV